MIRQHNPCNNFRFDFLKSNEQSFLKIRAPFGRIYHVNMLVICGSQHVISRIAERMRRCVKWVSHRLPLCDDFFALFWCEFTIRVRHIDFIM